MDSGSSDLESIRLRLTSQRASAGVQALIGSRIGDAAPLLYALVRIGPRPPAWAEHSWVYEACTFVSAGVPAGRIATLLVDGHQEFPIGAEQVTLELPATDVPWVREPSLASYKGLPLLYPATGCDSCRFTMSVVHRVAGDLADRRCLPPTALAL